MRGPEDEGGIDQTREGASQEQPSLPRIGREVFYPEVRPPTEQLRMASSVFPETIVAAVIQGLETGVIDQGHLRLEHTGNSPQVFELSLGRNNGSNSLAIELSGDWDQAAEIPQGEALVSTVEGRFYRKLSPTEQEPLAKEGDLLGPDDPLGVMMVGKSASWMYSLPPESFPTGGRITKFMIDDQADVFPGETIICYVEKHE